MEITYMDVCRKARLPHAGQPRGAALTSVMRNPPLSLLLGIVIAALGATWVYWSVARLDVGMRLGQASQAITVPGFIAIMIGSWLALRAFLLMRLREALLRGEGARARWQVSSGEWEAWRPNDAARSDSYYTLVNKLAQSDTPPPMEGVPIVFGDRAIVIGPSIVPLNVSGWGPFAMMQLCDVALIDGAVPSLEFTRFMTGKQSRIEVVRVPVGAAGRAQAQKVIDLYMTAIPHNRLAKFRGQFALHFQAQAGDAAGAHRNERAQFPERLALVALLLGLAAAGLGSGWFTRRGARPLNPEIAQILLAAGFTLLAVAAVLGFAAWRLRPPK